MTYNKNIVEALFKGILNASQAKGDDLIFASVDGYNKLYNENYEKNFNEETSADLSGLSYEDIVEKTICFIRQALNRSDDDVSREKKINIASLGIELIRRNLTKQIFPGVEYEQRGYDKQGIEQYNKKQMDLFKKLTETNNDVINEVNDNKIEKK